MDYVLLFNINTIGGVSINLYTRHIYLKFYLDTTLINYNIIKISRFICLLCNILNELKTSSDEISRLKCNLVSFKIM